MTKISTVISAVLIASATSFNVAAAEGEYYDGASKQAARSIDATVTGSIDGGSSAQADPEDAQLRYPTQRDDRRMGDENNADS